VFGPPDVKRSVMGILSAAAECPGSEGGCQGNKKFARGILGVVTWLILQHLKRFLHLCWDLCCAGSTVSSRHVSWALECLCKLQCLLLLVQEKGL